ncbi:pyrophosphatase PpaX [Cohnella algarum]|uniref:pyrophosphatase PpaX n=1 Tax=Cohnella algarum TaxID=2044859 RepID=UPI0019670541|nr:pyrophosphatase PpaX [Cohnella algarum]MBN2981477.1 pyrophosphatase PpaX [Cohnella algarum]
MKQAITTVLFDLDGTIIDTNELIIESVLHALEGVVPEGFSREHIIPKMGLPLAMQMQIFTGRDEVEELTKKYRAYNLQRHDEMVTLFPGVAEAVPKLKAAGLKLGIVTTKMRETSVHALKLLGIFDDMDVIVALDDVQNAKPHPEPVRKAMDALGADPRRTVMLGDSAVDIESARQAGAIPVGVAWSLKGSEALREAGAEVVIESMDELLTLCGIEAEPR